MNALRATRGSERRNGVPTHLHRSRFMRGSTLLYKDFTAWDIGQRAQAVSPLLLPRRRRRRQQGIGPDVNIFEQISPAHTFNSDSGLCTCSVVTQVPESRSVPSTDLKDNQPATPGMHRT